MDSFNPAHMKCKEADFQALIAKYLDPAVREEVTEEELKRIILAFNTLNLPLKKLKDYGYEVVINTEFMNDCLRCLRNVVVEFNLVDWNLT